MAERVGSGSIPMEWSYDEVFERTSRQAIVKLPCASDFSKSFTFSRFNLTKYLTGPPSFVNNYDLSQLIGEVSLSQYICDILGNRVDSSDVFVNCGVSLPNSPDLPLETCRKRRPDVSIRSSSHDIILIEVDSKGYESTIVHLVEGVIEQLVWLRNRDDRVTSCVGFYFPAKDRGPGVVEVKVDWSDSAFSFQIKEFAIEQHRVKTAIASCMDNGVQRVNSLQGESATRFTLPLSKSFIADTFGEDAHQVDSSLSVVIVNEKEKKVYKKPFCAFSDVRLLIDRQSSSFTKFLLPQRIFEHDNMFYYVFDRLKGPLSRELARLHVRDLAFSVWLALCEFHSFGYAHLDVRLENICYNNNNEAAHRFRQCCKCERRSVVACV